MLGGLRGISNLTERMMKESWFGFESACVVSALFFRISGRKFREPNWPKCPAQTSAVPL